MVDITMCSSANCKNANICYRKIAKVSELSQQSYCDFSSECEYYECGIEQSDIEQSMEQS